MKKIKKIIWKVLIKIKIGGIIQLLLESGLKDDGWFESFNTKKSVDKNGNPIRWCTYPFIKFIEPRLRKDFKVFEYGSGNSTLWYAARVAEITSVENDAEWHRTLFGSLPLNAKLIYSELEYNGEYCRQAAAQKKKFDIIIVDGRDRVNCIKHSIDCLKEDGVIVLDNSDLPVYSEGVDLLIINSFNKLDFIGLSPVTAHTNCTSIFYRKANCLNI